MQQVTEVPLTKSSQQILISILVPATSLSDGDGLLADSFTATLMRTRGILLSLIDGSLTLFRRHLPRGISLDPSIFSSALIVQVIHRDHVIIVYLTTSADKLFAWLILDGRNTQIIIRREQVAMQRRGLANRIPEYLSIRHVQRFAHPSTFALGLLAWISERPTKHGSHSVSSSALIASACLDLFRDLSSELGVFLRNHFHEELSFGGVGGEGVFNKVKDRVGHRITTSAIGTGHDRTLHEVITKPLLHRGLSRGVFVAGSLSCSAFSLNVILTAPLTNVVEQ